VLLLRDVLARSLFAKYQTDFKKLNRILDAYEPAANRIANTVAVGFVQERERVIRQQQEAIRELSTPVLQVRERLLILPIIGVIDPQRARQLTEQLLRGIRTNRAKVVVIDITGVAAMDVTVANHLVQTVEASRLLGATVIVTGLSPEIAQTLVTIGVDLGKMNTVGDLQGGIEQAERLLGYKVATLASRRRVKLIGGRPRGSPDSQTGSVPYRNVSSRAFGRGPESTANGLSTASRETSLSRSHRGCHGDGCNGFVCIADAPGNRAHDPAARCGNGYRRDSTGSGFCDGTTWIDALKTLPRRWT